MFNKSTRSYLFRALVFEQARVNPKIDLTWRQARLMFKGATAAAILKAERRERRVINGETWDGVWSS